MTNKPTSLSDIVEVTYSKEHWNLLWQLRQKAQNLVRVLSAWHIQAIVHGSIARGDIDKDSDIDVFIPNPPSSFQIETALEKAEIPVSNRFVIQATPTYAMKAYLEIDVATTISFPLMAMRRVELEFYRFSGEVDFKQQSLNTRVSGVDKRLMFIQPNETGHNELSIIGNEDQAAKRLRVAVDTVLDRVHALMKRDAVGRTGVFVKKELVSNETFELALKRLVDENPAVRRRLKSRL